MRGNIYCTKYTMYSGLEPESVKSNPKYYWTSVSISLVMYKLDLFSANISISLVAYELDLCNANMSISLLVYNSILCNANTSISLVVYELDDWRLVGRTRRSIRALPRAPSGLDQIFWNKLLYLFLFVFLCFLLQYSSHKTCSDVITKMLIALF